MQGQINEQTRTIKDYRWDYDTYPGGEYDYLNLPPDLAEEYREWVDNGHDEASAKPITITLYIDDNYGQRHPAAEVVHALYLSEIGRLGIAWGAPATWADVDDLESGIEMWLNDGEAWEARN